MKNSLSVKNDDPVLITGATGFIGRRVVANLLQRGFEHIRCIVRPTSQKKRFLDEFKKPDYPTQPEIVEGNLLTREDCREATRDVKVIYHLAAGTGTKSVADAFLNSVVTTRNLIEAALENQCLVRFVNLSTFSVYTNKDHPRPGILDENSAVETRPESRAEAYCYAKVKQDELVEAYGKTHQLPYVMLRPGVVYGPGKNAITGRVGVDSFGIYLHFGGENRIPFSYVDNCAEAVALAGLVSGIDGEVFNILDDDIPTSREFLKQYKEHVKDFPSIYVPHIVSYLFCWFWEWYANWSKNQLPPMFTRNEWIAYWKKTDYDNHKLKTRLGWNPPVSTPEGMRRFFESCREG